MKTLVVGSGGREHALAWRLAQSASVRQVYSTPGNPGTAEVGTNLEARTIAEIVAAVEDLDIDLTVVGPEALLVDGLVDRLQAAGRLACGPVAKAARLEGSKAFAKKFMQQMQIPTANYRVESDEAGVYSAVAEFGCPVVIKADGLAAGKGVVIVENPEDLASTVKMFFSENRFGASADQVVVEEFLAGEEVSFIALCDGTRAVPWAASKDYKRVNEGDLGPNTGGMGAHSPDGFLSESQSHLVMDQVMQPVLAAMTDAGSPFRGFLYAGLILTDNGPKVLEFNVRLGDPEAQPLLLRMVGDLGEVLSAAACGNLDSTSVQFSTEAAGCVVLAAHGYPDSPRSGDPIGGLAEARETGAVVFHAGTRLDQQRLQTSGGRVLNVCATAPDIHQALDQAYRAAELIQFEGKHYRRDLGARVSKS